MELCVCCRDYIMAGDEECWICIAEKARNGVSTADQMRALEQTAEEIEAQELVAWLDRERAQEEQDRAEEDAAYERANGRNGQRSAHVEAFGRPLNPDKVWMPRNRRSMS